MAKKRTKKALPKKKEPKTLLEAYQQDKKTHRLLFNREGVIKPKVDLSEEDRLKAQAIIDKYPN